MYHNKCRSVEVSKSEKDRFHTGHGDYEGANAHHTPFHFNPITILSRKIAMLSVWRAVSAAGKADHVALDAAGGVFVTAAGAVITVYIGDSGLDYLSLRCALKNTAVL
jgi:hypothetical protein